MTHEGNDRANDEFGLFIADIRDEAIEVISNLLKPNRADSYSLLIRTIFTNIDSSAENFSADLLPALVDEVITVLLQRIDKAALNDRKIDILYSDDLARSYRATQCTEILSRLDWIMSMSENKIWEI